MRFAIFLALAFFGPVLRPAHAQDDDVKTLAEFYPSEVAKPLLNGDFRAAAETLEAGFDVYLSKAPTIRQRINLSLLLADLYNTVLLLPEKAKPYYLRADALYDELIKKAEKGAWERFNQIHRRKALAKLDIDGPASSEFYRQWPDAASLISSLRAKQAMLELYVLAGQYGEESYAVKAGKSLTQGTGGTDAVAGAYFNWPGTRWRSEEQTKEKAGLTVAVRPRDSAYFNPKEGLPVPLGIFRHTLPVAVTITNNGASPLKLRKSDVLFETPLNGQGPTPSLTLDRIEQISRQKMKYGLLRTAWFGALNPQAIPYQTGGFYDSDLKRLFAETDEAKDARVETLAKEEWGRDFDAIMEQFDAAYGKYMDDQQERRDRQSVEHAARSAAAADEAAANRASARGNVVGAAQARARAQLTYQSVRRSGLSNVEDGRRNREAWNSIGKIFASPKSPKPEEEEGAAAPAAVDISGILDRLALEKIRLQYLAERFWEDAMPRCRVWPGELALKPGESWSGFLFFDLGGRLRSRESPRKGKLSFSAGSGVVEFDLKADFAADYSPPLEIRNVLPGGERAVFLETFQDILRVDR